MAASCPEYATRADETPACSRYKDCPNSPAPYTRARPRGEGGRKQHPPVKTAREGGTPGECRVECSAGNVGFAVGGNETRPVDSLTRVNGGECQ